jgi:hypothetical protein
MLTVSEELRQEMDAWVCPPLHVGDCVEVWPNPSMSESRDFGQIVAVNGKCADIMVIVPGRGLGFRVNCMYETDPDIVLKPDIFTTGDDGANNCGVFCFTPAEQRNRDIAARLPALEKLVSEMADQLARQEQNRKPQQERNGKPQGRPPGRPRGRPRKKPVVESPDKQVN